MSAQRRLNQALHLTRQERHGCNRCPVRRAAELGSLSRYRPPD